MRKLVGKVTEEEKNEILQLFERRNGLNELTQIVKEDDSLYERLVKDMGQTATKFQNWWNATSKKYNWESDPSGNWEIDFNTNEIFLNTPDK